MPDGRLVGYKYGKIYLYQNGTVGKSHSILGLREQVLGRSKLACRLFRLGIRAAESIDNEHIVISVGNSIFEVNIENGKRSKGWYCGKGVRPLMFTKVNAVNGFEDGVYFGGYLGNMAKEPVNIYYHVGLDKWKIVYTFARGTINHVHTIVPDPYHNCLWIFTGDFDEAAAIWKVTDNFQNVRCVACNDQKYRACTVFALPEGLLYATDAPFADNYVYLLNPQTMEQKAIFPIHGSCIYGCQWKDRFVYSSTVEGDGRNMSWWDFYFGRERGSGIKDNFVHLYLGSLHDGFREIYREKKDWLPYYTFQFGAFRFPYGKNEGERLYFMPVATAKHDLELMSLSEIDIKTESL